MPERHERPDDGGTTTLVSSEHPEVEPGLAGRWITTVTAAEALGYLAPAWVGVLTARHGVEGVPQALALAAAGLVEGAALGAGQAASFPGRLGVPRGRWIVVTALTASLTWAAVMGIPLAMGREDVPVAPAIAAVALLAPVALLAMAVGQWLVLRTRVVHAGPWVPWTCAAWLLGLPLAFAPGAFVDESTPLLRQMVLWPLGGLAMAVVVATLTCVGLVRVLRRG